MEGGCRPWAYITRQTTTSAPSSPKSPTPLATSKTTENTKIEGEEKLVPSESQTVGMLHTANNKLGTGFTPSPPKSAFLLTTIQRRKRFLEEAGESGLQLGRRAWECITWQTTSENRLSPCHRQNPHSTTRRENDGYDSCGVAAGKPFLNRVAGRGNTSHGKRQVAERSSPCHRQNRIPLHEQK